MRLETYLHLDGCRLRGPVDRCAMSTFAQVWSGLKFKFGVPSLEKTMPGLAVYSHLVSHVIQNEYAAAGRPDPTRTRPDLVAMDWRATGSLRTAMKYTVA
jgi:hypothetical protein|eukprot:5310814-Prymnesium_polylepis.1